MKGSVNRTEQSVSAVFYFTAQCRLRSALMVHRSRYHRINVVHW